MSKRKLIEHLYSLGSGEIVPRNTAWGLCHEIHEHFGDWHVNIVQKQFPKWPLYSGSINYPICDPENPTKPPHHTFKEKVNKWDDSLYARDRRNLCTFVARTLEDGISFRLCDVIFITYLVLIVLGTCFNINTAYEIVWLGYPATTFQLVVAVVTLLASLHICIMGDGIERPSSLAANERSE